MAPIGPKAAFLHLLLLQWVSSIKSEHPVVDVNTSHAKTIMAMGEFFGAD